MLMEARKKETLIEYAKTVRAALKEVYDGLINLEQSLKRLEIEKERFKSLEKIILLAEKKM